MKLKYYKIQFWVGIFCIFLSLFGIFFGSYYLYINDLTNFIEKNSIQESWLSKNINMTKVQSRIITNELIYTNNLGVLILKTSWYNFILLEIIIFIFGLNFIINSKKEKY